jgi:peptidoglycan/xylan/chitin deacetylase (PgdA/CDA1 family)
MSLSRDSREPSRGPVAGHAELAGASAGRRSTAERAGTPDAPELSVVVTTRNRSELLRLLLESLDSQTASPESYEVVVVVDGASDGTAEMLAGLAPRHALTVIEQPAGGSSAGRNAGAASARGRLLLFVDDDELAAPGLVSAHLEAHRSSQRAVVVGAIERRVPSNADRYARRQVDDARALSEQLASRRATYWDCYGGNCSLSRAAFEQVGGYAADLSRETDTELGYRLHAAGYEFVFEAGAVVSEYRTRPWSGIVADAELRGRIAVELYRRHPPMIARMPLGGGAEGSRARSRLAIASIALSLRVPPRLLAAVGLLLPGQALSGAWYAFALEHAYWCGVRAAAAPELWRRLRSGTLILGYHAFGVDGEEASRFVVPGRRFARQLGWLKRRGYNVITLGEYVSYRSSYSLPPPKTVVISIDDGYLDTLSVAGPILERLGLQATLFLLSAVGERGAATLDPALAGRMLIDWTAVKGLTAGPFEIGSHTRTHRRLGSISDAEAQAEIADSRLELERELGRPVTLFSYPFGSTDERVRALVEQSGYLAARGTQPGRNRPATDGFALRWLEICGTYSLARFAAALVLGELRR